MNIESFNKLKLVSSFGNTWDIGYVIGKFHERSIINAQTSFQKILESGSGFGDHDYRFVFSCKSESQWSESWSVEIQITIDCHVTCNGDVVFSLMDGNEHWDSNGYDGIEMFVSDKYKISDKVKNLSEDEKMWILKYIQNIWEYKMKKKFQHYIFKIELGQEL